MLEIKYEIQNESLGNLGNLSEIDIRYNFLLGKIMFVTSNATIKIDWDWIPLIDFSYSLNEILQNLNVNEYLDEYFEFTENSENIGFIREKECLQITTSFDPIVIKIAFTEFARAVKKFNFDISNYIKTNIDQELPNILKKYLN